MNYKRSDLARLYERVIVIESMLKLNINDAKKTLRLTTDIS